MSFEFDPNLNIDRAKDDNDPQDMGSLAGGDGLFGRVPLPIERQVQAQARGGVGEARGGPGTLGRVPSHLSLAASAASASVLPTSGYFGSQKRQAVEINARRVICPKHARGAGYFGSQKRQSVEINARRVICPKHARGAHVSRDYARHQEAATKAIPYPFASAKHFHAKNADDEASNKYANLQSKYAGNLVKIKTLKRRMGVD